MPKAKTTTPATEIMIPIEPPQSCSPEGLLAAGAAQPAAAAGLSEWYRSKPASDLPASSEKECAVEPRARR